MNNKFFLGLTLLFFCCISLHAQFKTIAESSVFEEPESGSSRILQMKNGSTFFLHIDGKDGININIYDALHKEIVRKNIRPVSLSLKKASILGLFQVNGDITLLVSKPEDRIPLLHRLIIDGKTGNLKDEKQVAELNKVTMGQGYAIVAGGVPVPQFYVSKDAYSDYYAVAMLNSFESDRNKRIEIIHFDPTHKEISRAYYTSPENKYKYLEYIDMTVIGRDKVNILAYAYNTKSSGGKESTMVLANLEGGSKTVTVQELKFSKDMKVTGGITRYNPVTKKILLLATVKGESAYQHYAYLMTVDPFSQNLEKTTDIYPVHASEKSMELFGKKHAYTGMPQNLYVNADGSYTVVFEEISTVTMRNSINTYLGNIAVLNFNVKGIQTGSYLIPKSYMLPSSWLAAFYQSGRESTVLNLGSGNQFKYFTYLNGSKKTYIMLNDIQRNEESVLRGKITTIQGVGECDGFYYELSGRETMPARKYIFGKPERSKDNNLALFAISDYNPESNLYVTLKLEKTGRDKGVRVVWMEPI